jgi:hypothetical protein
MFVNRLQNLCASVNEQSVPLVQVNKPLGKRFLEERRGHWMWS